MKNRNILGMTLTTLFWEVINALQEQGPSKSRNWGAVKVQSSFMWPQRESPELLEVHMQAWKISHETEEEKRKNNKKK